MPKCDTNFLSAVESVVAVKSEKELEPLVVNLQTAARLTGVSDRHLRKVLGEIPHCRIGNRLLFRVASLRQWLTERAQIGGAA